MYKILDFFKKWLMGNLALPRTLKKVRHQIRKGCMTGEGDTGSYDSIIIFTARVFFQRYRDYPA
ncbi:hypothetical protein ACULLL_08575 [Lysinibacillus irui]|uniref:hypothetical protein n=1 Tax=Lysinibacillus irui TaxID=2998077 RepID=UPI004043DC6A